jgi:hypothetical protein
MVDISIVSLIYRSPEFADWVHASISRHTPKLATGEAEFFFVANDATPELLQHLRARKYRHYELNNPSLSEAELFHLGYGAPAHMHAVYRGYNEAIRRASGHIVVLINSDNYMSRDWLENLLKYSNPKRVVCSKLVERWHPRFSLFPAAYHAEFGGTPHFFDENLFLAYAERVKQTGLEPGGAYMPCMFYREAAVKAKLYPEGNIAGRSFQRVVAYGDVAFFERLRNIGVEHVTALDSIVYHLKEGEMDAPGAGAGAARSTELQTMPGPAIELPPADPLFVVAVSGVRCLSRDMPTWKYTKRLMLDWLTWLYRHAPGPFAGILRRVWHARQKRHAPRSGEASPRR